MIKDQAHFPLLWIVYVDETHDLASVYLNTIYLAPIPIYFFLSLSYMDTVSSQPMPPTMSITIPGPSHRSSPNSGMYDTAMQSDSDDDQDTQSNASSTASSPREMRFAGIPMMTPIKSPPVSQNNNNTNSFKFSSSSSMSPSSRHKKPNSNNNFFHNNAVQQNNNNNFNNNIGSSSNSNSSSFDKSSQSFGAKSPTNTAMNGVSPSPTNPISIDFTGGAGPSFSANNSSSSQSSRPTLSRSSTGSKSGHSNSSRNSNQRLSSYQGKVWIQNTTWLRGNGFMWICML